MLAPDFVQAGFPDFVAAVESAALGTLDTAVGAVRRVREADIRNWYVEHAQIAGRCRVAVLKPSALPPYIGEVDQRANPSSGVAAELLRRDGYRCRYCHHPVVSRHLLKSFQSVVGDKAFPMGNTNASTHGAAIAYRAVADHVVPRKRGGRTDPENLVTACWPCNFGKAGYTVEQIGLQDPRTRPVPLDWSGLEHLVPTLNQRAKNLLAKADATPPAA
jgi:hypothetical protein